jgi:hypothetical protein
VNNYGISDVIEDKGTHRSEEKKMSIQMAGERLQI